jgi:methyl-accepting chemotaxis protein
MKIRAKLLVGFGVTFLLGAISSIFLFVTLLSVVTSFKKFSNEDVNLLNLAHQIRYEDIRLTDNVRGIIINPADESERSTYDSFAQMIDTHIKETIPLLQTQREKEIFQELNDKNAQLVDLETKMMSLAGSDKAATLQIFNGAYAELRKIFADNLNEFQQIQEERIAQKTSAVDSYMQKQLVVSISIGALSIILVIAAAFFISRLLTKPLKVIARQLKEISEGAGDLTKQLYVRSKDEIGDVALYFNQMVGNLRTMMRQIRQASVHVAVSSEQLTASSRQTSDATEQVATVMLEVSTATEKQTFDLNNNFMIMNQMSSEIQRIKESFQEVSRSSEISSELSATGKEIMQNAVSQMENVLLSFQKVSAAMEKLGSRSNQIEQVVAIMSEISSRTNLLALNASIEAARAGEYGKGFAVVASEVKKLAEQSNKYNSQIEELIQDVQKETNNAISFMRESNEELEQGVVMTGSAGQSFGQILDSVHRVAGQVQQIYTAVQYIASGAEDVNRSVEQTLTSNEEVAAGTQTVSAASQEQLAAMEEIAASAAALARMSIELQELVGKFELGEL